MYCRRVKVTSETTLLSGLALQKRKRGTKAMRATEKANVMRAPWFVAPGHWIQLKIKKSAK